jgi:hypothetical protein
MNLLLDGLLRLLLVEFIVPVALKKGNQIFQTLYAGHP